jgi:hypothetical protein
MCEVLECRMRATVTRVHVDTSATKARRGFGLQKPHGTGRTRRTSCTTPHLADDLENRRKMTAQMPAFRICAQKLHRGSGAFRKCKVLLVAWFVWGAVLLEVHHHVAGNDVYGEYVAVMRTRYAPCTCAYWARAWPCMLCGFL